MTTRRIKHFSPGILSRNGLYATLGVTYDDDSYVYFVGQDAYSSVDDLAAAMTNVSTSLRAKYDMDNPDDYHQIGIEFIERFKMKADRHE